MLNILPGSGFPPKPRKKHKILLVLLVAGMALATPNAYAARVLVPKLEIFLRASLFSENAQILPNLESFTTMQIDIEGNDNLGARIRLGHSGNLSSKVLIGDQIINQVVSLELVSLAVGEPFNTPVYAEIFSGTHDTFGDGSGFDRLFNIVGISSFFQGFRYFNANALYTGLHTVNGTGLLIGTEFGSTFASARLYLYNETNTFRISTEGTVEEIDTGPYAVDLRTMFDAGRIQLDFYLGATFNTISSNQINRSGYSLRTGFMANFGVDEAFELFFHIGVPYIYDIDKVNSYNFNVTDLQVLIEPRFNIEDSFGLHLTFLIRPLYYNSRQYADPGISGNVKMFLGSYTSEFGRGGFDLGVDFDSKLQFQDFKVSPFFGFTAGGVIWDLGIDLSLLPFSLNRFLNKMNISVGATASF